MLLLGPQWLFCQVPVFCSCISSIKMHNKKLLPLFMQICSQNFHYWENNVGLSTTDLNFLMKGTQILLSSLEQLNTLGNLHIYTSSSYHPPAFFHMSFKSPCTPIFQQRNSECLSSACKSCSWVGTGCELRQMLSQAICHFRSHQSNKSRSWCYIKASMSCLLL